MTNCWLWDAYRTKHGYGQFNRKGTVYYAHRYSYEVAKGPIPDGLTLDHLCKNQHCVNPDHLEPVTLRENLRRAGSIKLKPSDVEEIRRRIALGHKNTEIAASYGIDPSNISQIKRGYSWKVVPYENL